MASYVPLTEGEAQTRLLGEQFRALVACLSPRSHLLVRSVVAYVGGQWQHFATSAEPQDGATPDEILSLGRVKLISQSEASKGGTCDSHSPTLL